MWVILLIIGAMIIFRSASVRYTLTHLPQVTYYALVDLRRYFKFKQWNDFTSYGRMDIYCAEPSMPFGSGKTLNMVSDAIKIYNQYNDVEVYDFENECWCNQYVHIISNIELFGVPFVRLESTSQIVDLVEMDDNTDPNLHIYLILIDELGRIFNNRDWKNNLPSDLLGAMFQQRKNKLLIKGTVQDFSLFDATLRKLSSVVYICRKHWRFLIRSTYSATDIERSGYNLEFVQPKGSFCGFATDKLYNSYNTNEVVSDLAKNVLEGKQLTNYEVLQNSITNLPYVPKAKKRRKGA